MAKVEVNWLLKGRRLPEASGRRLVKALKTVSQLTKRQLKEVSVAVVGESVMKQTNWRYRGKKKVTDVLSFREAESRGRKQTDYLGEILICWPVCQKQAKLYKETIGEEFNRLLVHGSLHLLGYDHERSKKEERLMMALQEKILNKL